MLIPFPAMEYVPVIETASSPTVYLSPAVGDDGSVAVCAFAEKMTTSLLVLSVKPVAVRVTARDMPFFVRTFAVSTTMIVVEPAKIDTAPSEDVPVPDCNTSAPPIDVVPVAFCPAIVTEAPVALAVVLSENPYVLDTKFAVPRSVCAVEL